MRIVMKQGDVDQKYNNECVCSNIYFFINTCICAYLYHNDRHKCLNIFRDTFCCVISHSYLDSMSIVVGR